MQANNSRRNQANYSVAQVSRHRLRLKTVRQPVCRGRVQVLNEQFRRHLKIMSVDHLRVLPTAGHGGGLHGYVAGQWPDVCKFRRVRLAGPDFKHPGIAALASSPAGVELEPAAGHFFVKGAPPVCLVTVYVSFGICRPDRNVAVPAAELQARIPARPRLQPFCPR